jgi:GxxExxY protein
VNWSSEKKDRANELSNAVIGAAIEVHRHLGPGLLESAYRVCLGHELSLRNIPYRYEVPLPINYKGIQIDAAYRMDILVDDLVLLELKSVDKTIPIHEAQLLSYLKLADLWLGFLINFNVEVLKNGIKRMVNG